eukprot:171658-Amphidinium_carterae.1
MPRTAHSVNACKTEVFRSQILASNRHQSLFILLSSAVLSLDEHRKDLYDVPFHKMRPMREKMSILEK